MTAEQIFSRLKELAPLVAFTVTHAPDHYFSWDGDGPDPRDEGYDPHDVTVSAATIHAGTVATGENYLGGHYIKPGEPDPEISGYLPQMLDEAADELTAALPAAHPARPQLAAVVAFLSQEMRDRYAADRAEHAAR